MASSSSVAKQLVESNLLKIVEARGLIKIPYYNKHPSLGGQLTYLSPEAYEEKFSCLYSESVWTSPGLSRLFSVEVRYHLLPFDGNVQDRLESPLNNLAICYINETVGHVLIALEDMDPEEYPILFLYSGVINKSNEYRKERDDYSLAYQARSEDQAGALCLSSKSRGGLARFLPHLPLSAKRNRKETAGSATTLEAHQNEDELAKYQFQTPDMPELIACANCRQRTYQLQDGTPLVAIVLEHKVKQGEVLGNTYGEAYWKARGQTPELLFRSGLVVPHELYQVPHANVTDEDYLDPERLTSGTETPRFERRKNNALTGGLFSEATIIDAKPLHGSSALSPN